MNECPICRTCFEDGLRACPRDDVPLVPSLPGSPLLDGKYRLDRRLGQGGMGVVYRARHLGLERDLAVKLIRFPDDLAVAGRSFAERFAIEARALGRLQHPGIVSVTDYGIDPRAGGIPYLAMELLEGETLRDRLLASGPLPVSEALPLLAAIARAIDHAHAQGVLHRDLKPGNVLLGPEVKILDFGLARLADAPADPAIRAGERIVRDDGADEDATAPGALPATPRYLAPEVAAGGEATRAADVYSFAMVAWEVLASENLRQALAPAFDPRPEHRPGSAGAVVEALRAAWRREEIGRWRARELPRRLAAGLLAAPLAALLCALLPRLGPVEELELRTVDARLARLPPRVPDPRLLVISFDEASLAADATPLAVRAEELGLLLDRALAAGARGAAIDVLLPASWSRSPAFSRLLLKYPDRVTLAAFSSRQGQVIGTDCVAGLTTAALGPDGAARLFGFVNVEADRDQVVRRARHAFPAQVGKDHAGGWREAWAARAAQALAPTAAGPPGERFLIDPVIDWRRLDRISWMDLEELLAAEPGRLQGRLLLVGGDLAGSGDDLHIVAGAPGAPRLLSGIALQTLMVDTLLADRPIREAARGPMLAAVALASFVLLAAALCLPRRRAALVVFASLLALHLAVTWTLAGQSRLLLPVAAPLLALALVLGSGLAARRLLTTVPSSRAALGAIVLCLLVGRSAGAEGFPVAVVTAVQGSAMVRSPGTEAPRAVRLFDWLDDGIIVEVGPAASLHLAFLDGQRYRMGPGAHARLTPRGPQAVRGAVRFLERVPPLPRVSPLAAPEAGASRAAAIRLRGGNEIRLLQPPARAATLPALFDGAPSEGPRTPEAEGIESLALARELHAHALLAWRRGDLPTTERLHHRALAIRERLAPHSLELADSLNGLGNVKMMLSQVDEAERLYRQALEIRQALAPTSVELAASLNNLGRVALSRGDLAAAEEQYRRALVIQERIDPRSLDVARSLGNLGELVWQRGDLAAAETHLRRALELKRESLPPESKEIAGGMLRLGRLALDRGDLELAEDWFQHALAISEKTDAESLQVANLLHRLGMVVHERRDFARAESFYRRALALRERLAPGVVVTAESLEQLGILARDRGDPDAAAQLFARALAIHEKRGAGTLEIAFDLHQLAAVAFQEGDLAAAEARYRRALEIRSRLAPESLAEAESLQGLGQTLGRAGKAEAAGDALLRAIDSFERHGRRLGGREEARFTFGEKYAGYYRDGIEALLRLHRPEEALHVLERSRARSFLALLATRDLQLTADLPAELVREKQRADAEHERIQRNFAAARTGTDAIEVERLLAQLREIGDRREEIAARMRQASPLHASARDPRPLDLTDVGAALDPGTIFLAYSVGKEESVLFVVSPPPAGAGAPRLAVLLLSAGEQTLREKVSAFRQLIERRDPGSRERLMTSGQELYDLLVRPAEPLLARGDRLLISPDRPLHALPFAALVRSPSEGFLVAWKPLHVVASATVYAELRKERERPDPPGVDLVAFGDPRYPPYPIDPLPASRSEAAAIATLFAPRSRLFLGEQATEERVKAEAPGARYLHFAGHAVLDERLPLNSALALTIPEPGAPAGDNGLLQAWEILEQVRLSADLVTLSACESGLGQELRGEGLVGLTRAFQFAGARSVLASLWAVSDESTSALMTRFYAHLARGATKDEALRQAQLELLRDPATAHPFSWAAFQLFGDWK